ncbi:hypothetical protein R1flu_012938 [Riccia fluitans]|uniref:Uncharacterized protein n=1 Tax=Riccia fluitans TaxID=41844 RepID=A0ABD1ZC33_9MARC
MSRAGNIFEVLNLASSKSDSLAGPSAPQVANTVTDEQDRNIDPGTDSGNFASEDTDEDSSSEDELVEPMMEAHHPESKKEVHSTENTENEEENPEVAAEDNQMGDPDNDIPGEGLEAVGAAPVSNVAGSSKGNAGSMKTLVAGTTTKAKTTGAGQDSLKAVKKKKPKKKAK